MHGINQVHYGVIATFPSNLEPREVEWGTIMNFMRKIRHDDRGATAIEYGLIAALIAVAAITAMSSLGGQVSTTFNNVKTNLSSAAT